MALKERAIVSSFTLLSSLTGFYYAKSREKEVMPCVMVAGFLGAMLGEAISHGFAEEEPKRERKKIKR